MTRRAVALALPLAVLAAGCGGSGGDAGPPTRDSVRAAVADAKVFPDGAAVEARFVGGGWWVAWGTAAGRTYATVVRGERVVRGSRVRLRPLGPDPGETVGGLPQVAVEVTAPQAIVETALLLDGRPLDTRGGGLSPRRISVYGSPATEPAPGRHVVVAFASTGSSAAATAWTFRAR